MAFQSPSDPDLVFILYRVNRSVDIQIEESSQGEGDSRTMWSLEGWVTGSVERAIEQLKGERPMVKAFLKEHESEIASLCEASWCLRIMAVSCKEPKKGECLVNAIQRH